MEQSSSNGGKWCNLPCDLLIKICEQHVDPQLFSDFRRRLRAVCSCWRTAVRFPLTRPSLFPLQVPYFDDGSSVVSPAFIVENTYCLITPLHPPRKGWLVRLKQLNSPNTWRLLHPFDFKRNLFYTDPPIRSQINNLFDFQIRELQRSYDLVTKETWHPTLLSVMLTDSDSDTTNVVIVSIRGLYELAIWKLGDTKWTKLSRTESSETCDRYLVASYQNYVVKDFGSEPEWFDIAFHQSNFYALHYKTGDVYVIDPAIASTTDRPITFHTRCIIPAPPEPPKHYYEEMCWAKYFVQCNDQFFYVMDIYPWTLGCDLVNRGVSIFLLKGSEDDDSSYWWECVDDSTREVGNRVFFYMGLHSFAVSACELGRESGGGWLFYPGGDSPAYCFATPSCTKGFEDLDCLLYPLYFTACKKGQLLKLEGHANRSCKSFADLSDDDYTSILFPPPSWLKWDCPARGHSQVSFAKLPLYFDRLRNYPRSCVSYRLTKNPTEIREAIEKLGYEAE